MRRETKGDESERAPTRIGRRDFGRIAVVGGGAVMLGGLPTVPVAIGEAAMVADEVLLAAAIFTMSI